MTSVHLHPHPLAQRYVKPSNSEIAKKFGIVRVEDWDDRVAGETWDDRHNRGGDKAADDYAALASPRTSYEVVRCHTQSTGDLILLHDDWLRGAEVIA